MNTRVVDNLPAEDEILAFVHSKQKFVVDELTKTGLPADPADQKTLLSALADMSSAALSRKRIKVDEKQADSQQETNMVITGLLQQMARNRKNVTVLDEQRQIPTVDMDFPEPILVPGETSEIVPQVTSRAIKIEKPREDEDD
jgi:hypothetical protein